MNEKGKQVTIEFKKKVLANLSADIDIIPIEQTNLIGAGVLGHGRKKFNETGDTTDPSTDPGGPLGSTRTIITD